MTSTLFWLNKKVQFNKGETAAVALARAGITSYGKSKNGLIHTPFCGIGQCQSCLIKETRLGIIEACLLVCQRDMHLSPVNHNEESQPNGVF